jgi:hypothetical protein
MLTLKSGVPRLSKLPAKIELVMVAAGENNPPVQFARLPVIVVWVTVGMADVQIAPPRLTAMLPEIVQLEMTG